GSGKSTVARDVLYANLKRLLGQNAPGSRARRRAAGVKLIGCAAVQGLELLDRVLEVDQTPIGKTPRSCPATYIGFWDDIRRVYAGTTEARMRGYSASRFSFNTAGGRCEACAGQGMQTIEMSFLPDVKVLCDVCGGRRFNSETLAVSWREASVGGVLAMSSEDAGGFFAAHPRVHHPPERLPGVGPRYLTLGQPPPPQTRGEAPRINLVAASSRGRAPP